MISIEVDDAMIKSEYGRSSSKKLILEHAMNNFDVRKAFECTAKIFESYDDTKPVRKVSVHTRMGSANNSSNKPPICSS